MNGTNFFQTLESRTMFSTVGPPTTSDPGPLVQNRRVSQMDHPLIPGGDAVDTSNATGNGNGSGTIAVTARWRFGSELIRID